MPKDTSLNKILVIGSGPIIIGQAAEFDYSGTQGCLALKEEGFEVVLVNNNPATIMTDTKIADAVYSEPLTVESIEKIIAKERPDGLLATLGGQTALNLAVELDQAGILQKYGLKLLGTSIESIQKGEDRELFRKLMIDLNEPIPESKIVEDVPSALQFADEIGFPIIIRPAYTLGGKGGGIAYNREEFISIVTNGLKMSPINQVLVERSIAGFKEIEYEVMRDAKGTCITVCNMENIDPVGIHTGDSIVVAPSQTLTDEEYQMLRQAALKIIDALKVVGGCNIQFALDPESKQYYVIEVNPRVSRSSALASKATGYPIARMAAKLAVGYSLAELKNPLTMSTYASFEPALDYVVVKFPRWPFDKFTKADRKLGTKMKATGEVMAIERTMEAALQKAAESLELNNIGIYLPKLVKEDTSALINRLQHADDERFFILMELLRRGVSIDELHSQTKIDYYFLHVFNHLIELEGKAKKEKLSPSLLKELKFFGFSDRSISYWQKTEEKEIRKLRKEWGIKAIFKMVDTCAAEFEARTNYFYSTYVFGENEAVSTRGKKKALVIGSGPIRIGQGVEFDYSAVHCIQTLQKLGYDAIMINNNPETVSTDYETADRLYFEPLTVEHILNVVENENIDVTLVQFGGQTAINLAEKLEKAGVKLLGTTSELLDILEDRERFYQLLDETNIPHIQGAMAHTKEEAISEAKKLRYPILLRPSYVIGGKGMVKVKNQEELLSLVEQTDENHFPLLLDEFLFGQEAEVDLIADGKNVFIPGFMEHIEPAGVHSGDSYAIFPAVSLSKEIKEKMTDYAERMVQHLQYKGIMNIQFLIDGQDVYVLEVNPRASRTVPIVSKVAGVPLVDLATTILTGKMLTDLHPQIAAHEYVAIKYPVFSTHAHSDVDMKLGPEMKSTGEGMCVGKSVEEAMRKVFDHLFPIHSDGIFVDGDKKDDVLDYIKPVTDNFESWLEKKEAVLYYNPEESDQAKARRQKALERGIMVLTEEASFQAFLSALTVSKYTPISLHELSDKGVEMSL
ncbi:carbamoyl phosphate synthase large subunit [Aeribacillus pallidus]|uniref:Carbamoyl phosphate synthase large chain n=1 Tax=Aeribacillus pallidus TaxID=33936 RepID=A0A165YPU5_9BACI|nr:carbamoyl phosphate synthase large subunit [Aeribacillus pallidus]KZN97322.1 carbamoyl phosphate synthase large subunit [Aeribacillus pallidus]